MAAVYSTINIKPHYAEQARELAKMRGIPVGALIENLIEAACATDQQVPFDIIGSEMSVSLGDCALTIPLDDAGNLAKLLLAASKGPMAHLNLDSVNMVEISRRGVGVVIEFSRPTDQQRVRCTIGTHRAATIANGINAFLE